jgi:hypothetical protein
MNVELDNINREIAKVRQLKEMFREELLTVNGLVLDKEQAEALLITLIQLCDFLEDSMARAREARFEGLKQ